MGLNIIANNKTKKLNSAIFSSQKLYVVALRCVKMIIITFVQKLNIKYKKPLACEKINTRKLRAEFIKDIINNI